MSINLNIMTWIATGIMSSSAYLCDTLSTKTIDICGVAELTTAMQCLILISGSLGVDESVKVGWPCYGTKDLTIKLLVCHLKMTGSLVYNWK